MPGEFKHADVGTQLNKADWGDITTHEDDKQRGVGKCMVENQSLAVRSRLRFTDLIGRTFYRG